MQNWRIKRINTENNIVRKWHSSKANLTPKPMNKFKVMGPMTHAVENKFDLLFSPHLKELLYVQDKINVRIINYLPSKKN